MAFGYRAQFPFRLLIDTFVSVTQSSLPITYMVGNGRFSVYFDSGLIVVWSVGVSYSGHQF